MWVVVPLVQITFVAVPLEESGSIHRAPVLYRLPEAKAMYPLQEREAKTAAVLR